MRILIVRPRWLVDHQVISQPLGPMYLAATLRQWVSPVPEIAIYHMEAEKATMKDFRRRLEQYRPDVVAFSALSAEAPGLYSCLPIAREILPGSFIVVGGPHATIFPDHVLEKPEVDALVMGEGETTFVELIDRLQSGREWMDIHGIAYRQNGRDTFSPPRAPIENLDELPYPAWDLINVPAYNGLHNMNGFLAAWPYMNIFTSRACPFGCIYCHSIFGKKFRARSPQNVVEEIRQLVREHGVREIHIIDDYFNCKLDRAKDICRGIIEAGLKIKIAFPNAVRGDRLDDELIELLAEAGTYCMNFAVETATPRLQKLTHKNLDVNKVGENMKKAYEAGIIPATFYMMGYPTETEDEMRDTVKFAVDSRALKASFFTVLIYPRTGLYELARKVNPNFELDEEGFRELHYWAPASYSYDKEAPDAYKWAQIAARRFYLRPWRIWNILKMYPKNRNFLRALLFSLRLLSIRRGFDKIKARTSRILGGYEETKLKKSKVTKLLSKIRDE